MTLTPTELNEALDELGGRLLANQGPPTRQDAKRLVDALRQLRSEHAALCTMAALHEIALKGVNAESARLRTARDALRRLAISSHYTQHEDGGHEELLHLSCTMCQRFWKPGEPEKHQAGCSAEETP